MKKRLLDNMSTYFLIRELLYEGSAGIYKDIEPINVQEIQSELELRYAINFKDNLEKWVDWFKAQEQAVATEIEINSIVMTFKILQNEKKHISKLKNENIDDDD